MPTGQEKNLIQSKLFIYFYSLYILPPKQWNHTFPHGPHRSNLLSIPSSAFSACFWLVDVYKIIYQQPFETSVRIVG
jgi:hypothetical protein